jgi:hypothetical protein
VTELQKTKLFEVSSCEICPKKIAMLSTDTTEGIDSDPDSNYLSILTLTLRKFRKHIPDFEDLSKFIKGMT